MSSTTYPPYGHPAHHAAQAACHHVIHCAVDAPTREGVTENIDYARKVGDMAVLPILLVQLAGPCRLPAHVFYTVSATGLFHIATTGEDGRHAGLCGTPGNDPDTSHAVIGDQEQAAAWLAANPHDLCHRCRRYSAPDPAPAPGTPAFRDWQIEQAQARKRAARAAEDAR
jgi:hypothetical protein